MRLKFSPEWLPTELRHSLWNGSLVNSTETHGWKFNIILGNGLILSAITWASVDLGQRHHMPPLGHNALIWLCWNAIDLIVWICNYIYTKRVIKNACPASIADRLISISFFEVRIWRIIALQRSQLHIHALNIDRVSKRGTGSSEVSRSCNLSHMCRFQITLDFFMLIGWAIIKFENMMKIWNPVSRFGVFYALFVCLFSCDLMTRRITAVRTDIFAEP